MPQTDYIFAVKSVGLSTCNGRKPCSLLTALRHNRRTLQAEQGARAHIDPGRMHLNQTLAGAATPEAVAMCAATAMAWAGVAVDKLRKDHTQAIELLFSLPVGAGLDDTAYFQRCTQWAGQHFGADNILSSDIHRDESAPHCHVLVLPLVGGRMAGSGLITKEKTAKLNDSFWRDVAQPAGLKRPPARLKGLARGVLVKQVIEALQASGDPAIRSRAWQVFRAAIANDPQPFANILGIEAPKPAPKKLRTLAQIFTSPGKGAKVEVQPYSKPIGIDGQRSKPIGIAQTLPKHQSLSCVGIAFPKDLVQGTKAELSTAAVGACDVPDDAVGNSVQVTVLGGYQRIRDADFDVQAWAAGCHDDLTEQSIVD